MKTLKFLGIQAIYETIQADIDWEELNHRHVKFSWYLNTPPFVEEYHDVELSPFHPFPAFACSFKLYGKMYIIGGISEDKGRGRQRLFQRDLLRNSFFRFLGILEKNAF